MPAQAQLREQCVQLAHASSSAPQFEGEEVAGDLLQDELLQAPEIEQTEVGGLLDRGDEGLFGVGALASRADGARRARRGRGRAA